MVSMGDTKLVSMMMSNVQVEIGPKYTSLIGSLFRLFKNIPLTSTAYSDSVFMGSCYEIFKLCVGV